MKLASFARDGRPTWGALRHGRVVDLGATLGSPYPDLKALLGGGDLALQAAAATLASARDADGVLVSECAFLPVIPNPDKIICVGLNYEDHRVETGRARSETPVLFVRFAESQTGHGEPAWLPRPETSAQVDYEGELAVVVGRTARYVSSGAALEHVAGYACYNDISVRDWQRHTSQFTPGKNFPRTGAFGPFLVTADEVGDPHALDIETRLNGQVMQKARTDQMIFKVADLIAYCSKFTTLRPGDVISTGTPGGVGFARTPPIYLAAGDVVEVEISRIGLLRNVVALDPA
jgi:2-keto-4-pentenoate hydratase/2-oxohepta-3-ene-1,7-dioic acid hydratase in catechol pathway